MSRERFLPTALALTFVIGAGFAAASQLTLGFRAFTAEDARRIRIAAAPAPLSGLDVVGPDGANRRLWDADPGTRAWLVSFVYTRCPSICVAMGSEFQQLQAAMQPGDRVRLATISFDRAHDTPAELAGYAKRFHADPARWLVAAPSSDAALARLLAETGVVAIDDGIGGYTHNAAIHVVSPSGKLVALFDVDKHREALAFARTLP